MLAAAASRYRCGMMHAHHPADDGATIIMTCLAAAALLAVASFALFPLVQYAAALITGA